MVYVEPACAGVGKRHHGTTSFPYPQIGKWVWLGVDAWLWGRDRGTSSGVGLRYHRRKRNPYFLTYRFGTHEGEAMRAGFQELYDLAVWAAKRGFALSATSIRRYRLPEQEQEYIESSPGQAHSW